MTFPQTPPRPNLRSYPRACSSEIQILRIKTSEKIRGFCVQHVALLCPRRSRTTLVLYRKTTMLMLTNVYIFFVRKIIQIQTSVGTNVPDNFTGNSRWNALKTQKQREKVRETSHNKNRQKLRRFKRGPGIGISVIPNDWVLVLTVIRARFPGSSTDFFTIYVYHNETKNAPVNLYGVVHISVPNLIDRFLRYAIKRLINTIVYNCRRRKLDVCISLLGQRGRLCSVEMSGYRA